MKFLAQTETTKIQAQYERWYTFMEMQVEFGMDDSELHTKHHCARVLLLALKIAVEHRLSEKDIEALSQAAVFHDSRRLDDWLDVGHGQRAAEYYREFCTLHKLSCDERAYWIMAYHDHDDAVGIQKLEDMALENGVLLYQIFKDADALDRFRIAPDALDIKFLRTDAAKNMVEFAKKLVQNVQAGQHTS